MEFKSLKNIQTAFSQIRLYIIVFALLCVGITAYALMLPTTLLGSNERKSMSLTKGNL